MTSFEGVGILWMIFGFVTFGRFLSKNLVIWLGKNVGCSIGRSYQRSLRMDRFGLGRIWASTAWGRAGISLSLQAVHNLRGKGMIFFWNSVLTFVQKLINFVLIVVQYYKCWINWPIDCTIFKYIANLFHLQGIVEIFYRSHVTSKPVEFLILSGRSQVTPPVKWYSNWVIKPS